MISQQKVFTFHSLETQVAISKFLEDNFSVVYNQSYSYPTSFDELIEISKNCIDETILCAAGTDSNNAILMLVSCGNCRSILTETYLDRPNLINGAYWYLTPYYSFGFSPSLNIRQYTSDRFDCGVQTYTGKKLAYIFLAIYS